MNMALIKLTIVSLLTVPLNAEKVLFVGTFTEKAPFADGKGEGIYVYSMQFPSKKSLVLEEIYVQTLRPHPTFLTAFRKNGRNLLYSALITAERDLNEPDVYGFEFANNRLELIDRKATKGSGGMYVATDRKREMLMVANYWTGSIMSFKIGEDGKLSERSFYQWEGASGMVPNRQEGPHAHCIVPDPKNRYVYAADLGADNVYIYQLQENGTLSPHPQQPFIQTTPGSGPRHIQFDKTGDHLYLACELSNTVIVFDVRKDTGVLRPTQEISTLPADFYGESAVSDIHLTDNGHWLYVSNRGHNTLTTFAVGEDGSLRSWGWEWTRGKTPRIFGLMDDLMLVANQDSDNLALFWVDESSGALEFSKTFPCPSPADIQFLDVPEESSLDGSPGGAGWEAILKWIGLYP